ncbi:DUF1552 domain-containing protein [Rubripirellula sp.]|nr:DUF1552 domain-containing protein [Rubripirellula sp.]MCP4942781.1 DUF1552 domain-containing protein [Planctomycetaceae bacterium]MDC0317087.1 DUF1552 domain-containing protein [bacterium]MDA9934328.1 DUF1552 domain-containing protein [Rubripirellula sp.]MDB4634303.1 DUF1552 domain-containing protein [Rubripirellula sp.]MDC0288106.1 DUF1552 domain-containing protein [Rubripirellula sp.]
MAHHLPQLPHWRHPLTRRSLLRGTGAALALPWLEAMTHKQTRASEKDDRIASDAPIRMAALFVPNGVRQDQWTPKETGRDYELSPTLQPLGKLKDQLLVLTNLWNQGSNIGDGHYVKTSGFLTCTTINKSLGIDLNCNGLSMDQVAANHSGKETPIPSLELGIDPVTTGVDTNVGYTRVYGSHIAWSGPTSPLARELNPRMVFERLFRASHPKKATIKRDRLLLDRVLTDAQELKQKLGASDRQRMDEYLQSVRSIEKRLQNQQSGGIKNWRPLVELNPKDRPNDDAPDQYPEQVQLMLDMIALAFQTDTTRVCTFMFGNAVSGRNFSFLDGVTGGHHDTSHHQNNEDKLRQYQLINVWHIQQFAYLLEKLAGMQEREGTVLDNSMILYGSGLRDGNSHNPHNLPVLVAGSGGGKIATGQHLQYGRDTPLANLYAGLLNAFDAKTNSFADSTEILPGMLA